MVQRRLSGPGKNLGPQESFSSCQERGRVTVASALTWLSLPR